MEESSGKKKLHSFKMSELQCVGKAELQKPTLDLSPFSEDGSIRADKFLAQRRLKKLQEEKTQEEELVRRLETPISTASIWWMLHGISISEVKVQGRIPSQAGLFYS